MDETLRARATRNLRLMVADRDSDWPDRLLHDMSRAVTAPTSLELLTLRCYAQGMTTPMVAEAMNVAVETIKTRTQATRRKLGAKNTTHACCEAIRRGLIP